MEHIFTDNDEYRNHIKQSINQPLKGERYIDYFLSTVRNPLPHRLHEHLYSRRPIRQEERENMAYKYFRQCPIDMHTTPTFYEEDKFVILYGEENEKNIKDNYNDKLGKSFEGTSVSKGSVNIINGETWVNGLIAYNRNSIIIRERDLRNGQPGYPVIAHYEGGLAGKILELYLIPKLISMINKNEINSKTDAFELIIDIEDMFQKTYNEKYYILKNKKELITATGIDDECFTEEFLFSDAPMKEELNKIPNATDVAIFELTKKVTNLTSTVSRLYSIIEKLEERMIDISIDKEKASLDKIQITE